MTFKVNKEGNGVKFLQGTLEGKLNGGRYISYNWGSDNTMSKPWMIALLQYLTPHQT